MLRNALLIATGCSSLGAAQPLQPGLLDRALAGAGEHVASVVDDAEEHRVQVLLGRIEPSDAGTRLVREGFRLDAEYFYPASAIKLCAAVVALEELNRLAREAGGGIDVDTPVRIFPLDGVGNPVDTTVRAEIRKLFLVSDNDAFNRLFDLVGRDRLNERMRELGLESIRIAHRLSVRLPEALQRVAPRVEFEREAGVFTLPERPARPLPEAPAPPRSRVGSAYIADGEPIAAPMDFTDKNRASLRDLQDLLALVVRPDLMPPDRSLAITADQRALLLEAMTRYPGDSPDPIYDRARYPDDHGKFLLPGLERVVPKQRLRIANKVGMAYGFTIENAYVEDTSTGEAFFLAAVVYTNADGVLNDDRYEYESVALPFMAGLGEATARQAWSPPQNP